MFLDNFRRFMIQNCGTSPTYAPHYLDIDGTDVQATTSYHKDLDSITNIKAITFSSLITDGNINGGSTFCLGIGETPTTPNMYILENIIDDTDFTVVKSTRTLIGKTTLNAQCLLEQTYRYTGNTPITINEIGLAYKLVYLNGRQHMALVARVSKGDKDANNNPLFTPISLTGNVDGGEIFTVSMVIG